MVLKKAWRDPCAKCAQAAFMYCLHCESMDVQKVRVQIKLKTRVLKHKEKPCVTITRASG